MNVIPNGWYALKPDEIVKIGDKYYCSICNVFEIIDKNSYFIDMTVEESMLSDDCYSNFIRKIKRSGSETDLKNAKWE